MELNEWVDRCYSNAEEHGFVDQLKTFGHDIGMIHCELSEALMAHRQGEPLVWTDYAGEPKGPGVELADAVMRIFTLAKEIGIDDFEAVLHAKYEYNRERPYLHGKKYG